MTVGGTVHGLLQLAFTLEISPPTPSTSTNQIHYPPYSAAFGMLSGYNRLPGIPSTLGQVQRATVKACRPVRPSRARHPPPPHRSGSTPSFRWLLDARSADVLLQSSSRVLAREIQSRRPYASTAHAHRPDPTPPDEELEEPEIVLPDPSAHYDTPRKLHALLDQYVISQTKAKKVRVAVSPSLLLALRS